MDSHLRRKLISHCTFWLELAELCRRRS